MMDDLINMSLDDIIKRNKNHVSRSRGRGNGTVRGRGGARGRGGRGRGRGAGGRGRGGGGGRGRSQSRPGTPSGGQPSRSQSRTRSQSQNRRRSQSRQRSQSQNRSQTRNRSRSRQRFGNFRARSASRSRSQLRGLTPKGRAGLEVQQSMPPLTRNQQNRGGMRGRLYRSNSNPNLQGSIHSRLGVTTRRGAANFGRPLAIAKRGISKRGRGYNTGNRYSNIGLRSDQILKEQRQYMFQQRNNMVKSQTFRRSRNNSFNSASQLTVSVANEFIPKRRNSVGNSGYLDKQSLAQLVNQLGGYNLRRGPGSVRSMGSNRSNYSNRSHYSNRSNGSRQSNRSRGRGRGGNRGVGRKFVNKQILNPKLQKEIAAIQGKSFNNPPSTSETSPGGINFTPTPAATTQSLNQRFASK